MEEARQPEVMTADGRLGEGMRFDVRLGTGHTLTLDAGEEHGGGNAGPRPVEILLGGLAGCTGMDVISILRKKRQQVVGYEVRVRGVRADEHPRVYTGITIEHIVTGHGVDPVAVARAIELSATRYCPTEAMLGVSVPISNAYEVRDAATGETLATGLVER